MTIVEPIETATPQSIIVDEYKINVDSIVNKELNSILKGCSEELLYIDEVQTVDQFVTECDKTSHNSSNNESGKEVYDDDVGLKNENENENENDSETTETSDNSVSNRDRFVKYHYSYASAIDSMSENDVGLVCFPIQKRLQVYKNGCNFTLLCVGESGVGKTSFVNTLFHSLLIDTEITLSESLDQNPDKTTIITHHKMDLVEEGFKMRLNIIDTPGFGDFVDNKYCWYPITRYIDEQYRRLVYQENQPSRSNLVHSEVHACLYFIAASSLTLSQSDIDTMKNLSARVNLIPIISKADGCTFDELNVFKQKVRNTLKEENIQICELFDEKIKSKSLISEMPFATINSIETYLDKNNNKVRGRKYKWGLSEVENPEHCDFLKIRDFLIRNHMGDLILSTENYYERYRRDFMKYRLAKAINLTVSESEIKQSDVKEYNKEVIIPNSRDSWTNVTKDSNLSHPSLSQLIDTKDSIEILHLLNRTSLDKTEKELVELNPKYLEMERQVKKKFMGMVQAQNQKFKNWKRTLYEKQDKFNKDIEQIHKRMIDLQDEIKNLN